MNELLVTSTNLENRNPLRNITLLFSAIE